MAKEKAYLVFGMLETVPVKVVSKTITQRRCIVPDCGCSEYWTQDKHKEYHRIK